MTTHKEWIDIPDGWTYTPQSGQTEDPGLRTLSIVLYRIPMPKPEIETKIEILAQNVNMLIQDVRTVQAKLDAMGNRLTSIQWFHVPSMTPIDPPPYGTLLGPVTCEAKSYAEKEFADNTAPKEKKP